MKFGNVALYCKGWYKHRDGGVKTMWMDMLHCINADGWSLWSKEDVVEWCIHRMDSLREDENFPYKHQLDLTYFWKEINDIIRRDEWYYHEGLDMNDAIILHYRNIISNIEGKYFNELLVKPNPNVLPLNYQGAYYSDGKYRPNNEPEFTFADMHCDLIEKINEMFPNHEEQEIKDSEFEYQEAWIRGKNWQDVVVLVGSDNLNDCEEVELKGKFLKNTHNEHYKDDDFLDLNIYEHTINFDENKTYVCRVKKEIEEWNWGNDINYKLMSVLNEKDK
jgi:hypothetical protein